MPLACISCTHRCSIRARYCSASSDGANQQNTLCGWIPNGSPKVRFTWRPPLSYASLCKGRCDKTMGSDAQPGDGAKGTPKCPYSILFFLRRLLPKKCIRMHFFCVGLRRYRPAANTRRAFHIHTKKVRRIQYGICKERLEPELQDTAK